MPALPAHDLSSVVTSDRSAITLSAYPMASSRRALAAEFERSRRPPAHCPDARTSEDPAGADPIEADELGSRNSIGGGDCHVPQSVQSRLMKHLQGGILDGYTGSLVVRNRHAGNQTGGVRYLL